MKPIESLVRAKLAAQAGPEGAVEFWTKLWDAYQKEGADGAARVLEARLAGKADDEGGEA